MLLKSQTPLTQVHQPVLMSPVALHLTAEACIRMQVPVTYTLNEFPHHSKRLVVVTQPTMLEFWQIVVSPCTPWHPLTWSQASR